MRTSFKYRPLLLFQICERPEPCWEGAAEGTSGEEDAHEDEPAEPAVQGAAPVQHRRVAEQDEDLIQPSNARERIEILKLFIESLGFYITF